MLRSWLTLQDFGSCPTDGSPIDLNGQNAKREVVFEVWSCMYLAAHVSQMLIVLLQLIGFT